MNQFNEVGESLELGEIIKETESLREVTYSYIFLEDGTYLNETVLLNYIRLDIGESHGDVTKYINDNFGGSKTIFLEHIKGSCLRRLEGQISFLEMKLPSRPELATLISALNFTKNGLDFELEKAGLDHGLSQEEIDEKVALQYVYDSDLFGEKVSENLDFVSEAYAFLLHRLQSKYNKLTKSKIAVLEKNLHKIKLQIEKLGGDINDIVSYKKEPETEYFEDLHNIKISRDDYVRLKDLIFEVSNVAQRCKIGNYGSFYDADDFYGVPNIDEYSTKTLGELTLFMPHEANHYINLKVTTDRGDHKRPGDMIKEEGAAKAVEKKIKGVQNADIQSMTMSGPGVVLAQLLDGKDFLEFQDSYYELLTLYGDVKYKGDIMKLTLRKKRGFPMNIKGAPNKDSAYPLGLGEMKRFFKQGGSIKNTFGGKISISDMKSGKFSPEDFGNKYIPHILFTELTIFSLQNKGEKRPKDFHKQFINYMKEKYKDFSDDFEFFNESERFSILQKRKLIEALKIIDESKKTSIDEDRKYHIAPFSD